MFAGDAGEVVHPGTGLEVTRVEGPGIVTHPDAPWEFEPELVIIPYRVAAEGAQVREDILQFRVSNELNRLKAAFPL